MFIGSDVCRCPLPLADKPGAEAYGVPSAACIQPTQMGRRACCNLHTQFLAQLPGERSQLRLASLDVSAGQIPHTRVCATLRTPVDEKDSTFANQRRDNYLVHGSD
jgi:hypothetical protein